MIEEEIGFVVLCEVVVWVFGECEVELFFGYCVWFGVK